MDNIIKINNLNFKYKNKQIFKDFNLNIKKDKFTSIIGPNGSGKTTLVKILLGLLEIDGIIEINNIKLNKKNIKEIREQIGVVYQDNQFVAETVMDEIAFSLENLNYPKKEIRKQVKAISELFKIEHLLQKEPHSLNSCEKGLVVLASALVTDPKILILDEGLNMLDSHIKEDVLKKLKILKGITIINITHDSEELIYSDEIVVIDNGNLILRGDKELVLKEEQIFKKLGLQIPFMVDLSQKLMFYGLIDEIIYDMDEMVNILWK